MKVRGYVATALGVALSAIFLWLALRNVDARMLSSSLAGARWWTIAPFLASLFAFYWIKTIRWAVLLQPVLPVGPRRLFGPVMIGYAAGAILPMQLGEFVRAWLGARRLGIRMAAALMSIALERVLDLVSILLLAAATVFGIAEVSDDLRATAYLLGGFVLAALAALLVLVFRTEACLRFAVRVASLLPAGVSKRVLDQFRAGVSGLAALRNVRLSVAALGASLLQWAFMYGCIWLSLYALSISTDPAAAMLVLLLTVIGTSLPNSPGYVGSIQLAFTLALVPFGVEASLAVAASLYFHVLAYLSVVISGLLFLPAAGLRFGELRNLSPALRDRGNATGSSPPA